MATLNESSGIKTVSSGSSSAEGSYVELIASTARATTWMSIYIGPDKSSSAAELPVLDIAFGASSSEVDQIPDVAAGGRSGPPSLSESTGSHVTIPFAVPASTRVSARIKEGNVSAIDYEVNIRLFQ